MPSIDRITDESAFDAGWWLDWAQDPLPGAGQPARLCPVGNNIPGLRGAPLQAGLLCPPPTGYHLRETEVRVSGPQVEVRFCGDTFSCNLTFGDGLLVAPRSPGPPTAMTAPIRLRFTRGLRAVGTYVAGGSLTKPVGARFVARLWVRLDGQPNFEPAVSIDGNTGAFGQAGVKRAAPFLGARSLVAARIVEACFDLSPQSPDEVDQVVLSQFYAIS